MFPKKFLWNRGRAEEENISDNKHESFQLAPSIGKNRMLWKMTVMLFSEKNLWLQVEWKEFVDKFFLRDTPFSHSVLETGSHKFVVKRK